MYFYKNLKPLKLWSILPPQFLLDDSVVILVHDQPTTNKATSTEVQPTSSQDTAFELNWSSIIDDFSTSKKENYKCPNNLTKKESEIIHNLAQSKEIKSESRDYKFRVLYLYKTDSLIIKTGRASEKASDALIGYTSTLQPVDPAVQQVVDALPTSEIVQENPQKRRRNKKAASQPTDIEDANTTYL